VLVLVTTRFVRFCEANGSYSNQDKHKAPTSTQPHPLSLQDAEDISVPMSTITPFGKIHQDEIDYHIRLRESYGLYITMPLGVK